MSDDVAKRVQDQMTELYAQWRVSPDYDSTNQTDVFVADMAQMVIALAALMNTGKR